MSISVLVFYNRTSGVNSYDGISLNGDLPDNNAQAIKWAVNRLPDPLSEPLLRKKYGDQTVDLLLNSIRKFETLPDKYPLLHER